MQRMFQRIMRAEYPPVPQVRSCLLLYSTRPEDLVMQCPTPIMQAHRRRIVMWSQSTADQHA